MESSACIVFLDKVLVGFIPVTLKGINFENIAKNQSWAIRSMIKCFAFLNDDSLDLEAFLLFGDENSAGKATFLEIQMDMVGAVDGVDEILVSEDLFLFEF